MNSNYLGRIIESRCDGKLETAGMAVLTPTAAPTTATAPAAMATATPQMTTRITVK